jgi:hypothetical protein
LPNVCEARTIVKLRKVRRDYQTLQLNSDNLNSDNNVTQRKADLENQTGELLNEWRSIQQEERVLLETITQCMRAATMGKQVIEAADHDDLDIAQLNGLIPTYSLTASGFRAKTTKPPST